MYQLIRARISDGSARQHSNTHTHKSLKMLLNIYINNIYESQPATKLKMIMGHKPFSKLPCRCTMLSSSEMLLMEWQQKKKTESDINRFVQVQWTNLANEVIFYLPQPDLMGHFLSLFCEILEILSGCNKRPSQPYQLHFTENFKSSKITQIFSSVSLWTFRLVNNS